ncbi:MAG: hypothetical protein ACE14W_10375 [Candidatus Velamenicoccus archaeovorus]
MSAVGWQTQTGGRATPVIAIGAGVVATGAATWLVLAGRPRAGGLAALVAGGLLLLAASRSHGDERVRERMLDSLADRLFDAGLLSSIAWTARAVRPALAAGALLALGASFLSAYIRARGASLGYAVEESAVTRAIRYGLVGVGLAAGWLPWAIWVLAAFALLASAVRAGQVAKEERA